PRSLRDRVALVLTSPPYGDSVHGQAEPRPGAGVARWDDTYSADPTNLAHVGLDELLGSLEAILAVCSSVLRPHGIVAITTRPWRRGGALVDLPGAVLEAGERAGPVPRERIVALLAALRDGALVPRAAFFQLDHVRTAPPRGL